MVPKGGGSHDMDLHELTTVPDQNKKLGSSITTHRDGDVTFHSRHEYATSSFHSKIYFF